MQHGKRPFAWKPGLKLNRTIVHIATTKKWRERQKRKLRLGGGGRRAAQLVRERAALPTLRVRLAARARQAQRADRPDEEAGFRRLSARLES